MTTTTAVHTNGSHANLSPPERQALVEKLRGLVLGAATEDVQALIERIKTLERSSIERIVDEIPWLNVSYRDASFSALSGGTNALRTTLMDKLRGVLIVEPSVDPAPVADTPDAAHNGAAAAPKAAKPRRRKPKGKPRKDTHAIAPTSPALLPAQYQQVIQALKSQREGADESTQNLLDAMVQAAERNDRVALEAIRTQVGTNTAVMRMFGMLWAALEDTQTRYATLLMEAAAGFHPRASFLEGRSLFRDSVAQIRERSASTDPGMAVEQEHDDDSQSES